MYCREYRELSISDTSECLKYDDDVKLFVQNLMRLILSALSNDTSLVLYKNYICSLDYLNIEGIFRNVALH
jgi:hypothetical protein